MTEANILEVNKLTWAQERFKELGITDANNQVRFTNTKDADLIALPAPIFTETKEGDIEILYTGLKGLQTYISGKKEKPYSRVILSPEREAIKGKKFYTPPGAGVQVFFPPYILELYNRKAEIKTLVITANEPNAWAAALQEIPCIALQGMTNFYKKSQSGKSIQPEIVELLKVCRVKNIILLFEGDLMQLIYEADKDLTKKFEVVFSAVKDFKESIQHLGCSTHFFHIEATAPGIALEKLLSNTMPGDLDLLKEDLLSFRPGAYFKKLNITNGVNELFRYLYLHKLDYATFYTTYAEILKDKRFIHQRTTYQHKDGQLDVVKIEEANQFMRVGDNYLKISNKPINDKETEPVLLPILKTTITDDYRKKAPNILDMITKYEGFINIPSHVEYKRVYANYYNMYSPLPISPEEGEITQTMAFLSHIFGEQLEIGLDYLQLLYTNPTQFLPVLCLVSKENNTGKSTFPKWLRTLFGDNITATTSAELESPYNDNYAAKLGIYVDEAVINKFIKEKIKNLSTSEHITLSAKFKANQEIKFFGKFILCSNNEENFISVDSEDIRFWVRKIHKPAQDNVNLLNDMKQEAPAFLHFLQNRQLNYPEKKSRMWFPPGVLMTEALRNIIDASKSYLEKAIKGKIREKFLEFGDAELKLTKKMLLTELMEDQVRTSAPQIEECLKNKFKVMPGANLSFKIPGWHYYADVNSGEQRRRRDDTTGKGMPYTFKIEDFLTPDELEGLGIGD